jgi:hypothetical protein
MPGWIGSVSRWLERYRRAALIAIIFLVVLFVIKWAAPIESLSGAEAVAKPNAEGINLYVALWTGTAAVFTAVSAIATFFLALFTWRTLRASLLAGEDERRRHQQSMAPVLEIVAIVESGDLKEVIVRNAGTGVAQQAWFEVRGFYRNPLSGKGFKISHSDHRSILAVNDQWRNAMERTLGPHGALRADGFGMYAVLTYRDIFNNTYYTITQDVMRRGEMEWIRPASVYPDRSRFEAGWADIQDMDNVIDALEYNGPVSSDGSP